MGIIKLKLKYGTFVLTQEELASSKHGECQRRLVG